jgi:hypothetical protein
MLAYAIEFDGCVRLHTFKAGDNVTRRSQSDKFVLSR